VVKPHWLLQLFTDDKILIKAASEISNVVFLGFIFSGISMMCSGLFQAMGKALPAIILDSIRTYILLLPAIIYLPAMFGVSGIWWAFPLADYSGVMITVLFTAWYLKSKFPSSAK
jgi:Na+-driven multidrug efflux pump